MVVHLEISQQQPSSFRRLFVQAERLLKSQHASVKLAGRIKIVSSKSDMSHTNNLGTSGRSRRRAARARLRHARRDQHRKQQHLQYFHGERWWTSKRPTVKLRREGKRLPAKDPCILLWTPGAKGLSDFARIMRR